MMSVRVDIGVFIERFFGEGNTLSLDAILDGREPAVRLRPWIDLLTGEDPEFTVLPRKPGLRQHAIWYGIALSERSWRRLGQELVAFVGPTYSDFHGGRAQLDPADPIEAAVLDLTRGAAYKFMGQDERIWPNLELMRYLWESRPDLGAETPRATGRVLRDFFMALQVGNRTSAEEHLLYLHNNYRLDTLNLIFLRVQLLAELGFWEELLNLPQVGDLVQSRRPLAVTRALIRALYHRELAVFEEQGDPEGATKHFVGQVLPKYGGLFVNRRGFKEPEILKCFMMLAVGGVPRRPELRDELLGIVPETEKDWDYLRRLAALLPVPAVMLSGDLLELATEAVQAGDYDRGFSHALDAPDSLLRARLLLECAYELQTLAAERAAVEAVLSLPAADYLSVTRTRRYREVWAQLVGDEVELAEGVAVAEIVPLDWLSWLHRLNRIGPWQRALAVARTGALEWQIDGLLTQPGGVDKFVELLNSPRKDEGDNVLYNALPHMLFFFQSDTQWPRSEFAEIYASMLDILVISTEGGDDDLTVFNELVSALLSLGVRRSRYVEILGYANELWNRYASQSKLDWILDFLDLLILHPCADEEERTNLLFTVSSRLGQFSRRVEQGQLEFLRILYEDYGQLEHFLRLAETCFPHASDREAAAEQTLEILLNGLHGKTVALYSLTEKMAKRVKELFERNVSGVDIRLSHDLVGNERLRRLAHNAHLFIVCTASAKHAATEFIGAHRPPHLPTLYPKGKGSASVLRAIIKYLQNG